MNIDEGKFRLIPRQPPRHTDDNRATARHLEINMKKGRELVENLHRLFIPASPFTEKGFEVNALIPERAFRENVYPLHDELRKG